jgi:hypothetical protein
MAAKHSLNSRQFNNNSFYFIHGSPDPNLKELDPKSETMADRIYADPPFEERWPEHMLNESGTAVKPEYANTGQLYGYNATDVGSTKMHNVDDLSSAIEDSIGYGGNIHIGLANARTTEFDYAPSEVDTLKISSKVPVLRTIRADENNPQKGVKDTLKALRELGVRE